MVEFKRDSEGKLKLMEINPKFWGSLELSLKAGVNFPYLDYLMALNKKLPRFKGYRTDIYFRWILPYDKLWVKFSSKEKVKEFKMWEKNKTIYKNIYFDDPLVNVFNVVHYFYKLLKDKRYPHGRVEK